MNYIENVYVCLSAPLVIAIFFSRGKIRQMLLFLVGGGTVCLLSSYISTFLAAVNGMDPVMASLTIAPPVEECMKLLPLIFYLVVFEPEKSGVSGCVLMISVGFATFENVCFLAQNGAESFSYLLIRGFGAGAMHVVCGAILAVGLMLLWDRLWLRVAGMAGLVALTTTYHGIYNILVSRPGTPAVVGYLIPLTTAVLGRIFGIRWRDRMLR